MDFIHSGILEYAENHSTPESQLLAELNRFTYSNLLMPRMLSGHIQGRFLSAISKMIRPEYILEIGTYSGYSALCLAEGLIKKGKLITLDINDELAEISLQYIQRSVYKNQIECITGDALKLIPQLKYSWDLIFLDADKENYPAYYELLSPNMKSGAWLIIDNVLWSGRVMDESIRDKDTKAVRLLNERVAADSSVEVVMLPLRDGITLIRKK